MNETQGHGLELEQQEARHVAELAKIDRWFRRIFIGYVFLLSAFLSIDPTGLLDSDHQFLSIITTVIMGVMIIQSTGRKPV